MARGGMDHDYIALLAKRIREGDQDAFAELYDETYPTLYRYAYYFLRSPDEIPDVLQEIYISVYKNIDKLKLDRLLMPWMRQIAYRTCCDFAKRLKNERESSTDFDPEILHDRTAIQSEADSLRTVYDRDLYDQLRAALADRPVKERQAFLLRYENNLKLEEIADFMNVSLASVKRYIASARECLQERLAHLRP